MKSLIAPLILAALILATGAHDSDAAKKKPKSVPMTEQELHVLLDDGENLMLGGPDMGYTGSLTVNADGTAHGEVKTDKGDVIGIKGAWHVSGDKFCRTWEGGRDAGKEICERWIKAGEKRVTVMVGKKDYGVNSWK